MSRLQIVVGGLTFIADWEEARAPKTCAGIKGLLPLKGNLMQVRWSGEASWIDIDHLPLNIDFENHTSYPAVGQLIVYPGGGGYSVKEILIPHGSCAFGSKVGLLAGNHFATLVEGRENLPEMGRRVWWEGAQDVEFSEVSG